MFIKRKCTFTMTLAEKHSHPIRIVGREAEVNWQGLEWLCFHYWLPEIAWRRGRHWGWMGLLSRIKYSWDSWTWSADSCRWATWFVRRIQWFYFVIVHIMIAFRQTFLREGVLCSLVSSENIDIINLLKSKATNRINLLLHFLHLTGWSSAREVSSGQHCHDSQYQQKLDLRRYTWFSWLCLFVWKRSLCLWSRYLWEYNNKFPLFSKKIDIRYTARLR